MLDETLFTFIDKPKLFSVNLDELIEVDALLQDLYVVDDQEGFVGHAVLSNEEYGSESILVLLFFLNYSIIFRFFRRFWSAAYSSFQKFVSTVKPNEQ